MMKRLLVLIMVLASCTLSAVSIQSIRAENYSGVVCRLVLTMDQDVDFTVNQQGNDFYLVIDDFDGHIPAYTLSGTFLNQIEPTAGGLRISSPLQLRYLTMRLSDIKALVIDFIKITQSKKERLIIAQFLTDKGRLSSADKEYSTLARDYPDHYDVFYSWGELLLKRGSSRAAEKLGMIPEYSSYYTAAQDLLNSDNDSSNATGKSEGSPEQPEPEIQEAVALQTEAEADPDLAETSLQDSIILAIPPEKIFVEKPNFLSSIAELASRYILLTIAVFVAILVILGCLIFGSTKKARKKPKQDIEESSLGLDTDTLCKMVNRLLADGWTNKEIARELKINLQEVELIVRRLHYMGISEDDAKE